MEKRVQEDGLYLSRKHIHDFIFKFSTSKIGQNLTCRSNRLRKQTEVAFSNSQVSLANFHESGMLFMG
jgi:hypothetical protein